MDAIVDLPSPASRLFGRLESEQGYFDTRTCPEDGFGTVIFARQKSKLGECCLQEIRDVLGRYFCRTYGSAAKADFECVVCPPSTGRSPVALGV